MATIVILEHALQRDVRLPYMMHAFAEHWRRRRHRVHIHHGLENAPEGDLAVMHVDLTVVPEAYRALASRYGRVLNARVPDVSKSRFSQDLLDRYADWIGPVIVKTEANYGGKPEQLFGLIAEQAGVRADFASGPVAESYPMYAALRDVPEEVWRTPGLVVERFLPEREGRDYCLRVWTFLGDRERSVRWRAAEPIVKAHNMTGRDTVEVPDEIRAWRERLGFDFGKFDYVRYGERWVLLDVNRTPSYPRASVGPNPLDALSEGIEACLR